MKIIILLGIHGSGKGEQMKLLVKNGYIEDYISTGEAYVSFHDPNSRYHKYKAMITPYEHLYAEGNYFPDKMTMDIVKGELKSFIDAGYVNVGMEGFPRNLEQAQMLTKAIKEMGGINLQFIYLDLPDTIAKERLVNRSKTEHRDTDAVDQKRTALYHEVTDPMIAYLRKKGLVRDVDGRLGIEEVHRSIVEKLG